MVERAYKKGRAIVTVTENELIAHATERKAPRVTLEQLKANIMSIHYINAYEAASAAGHPVSDDLKYLTLCILVLANGFTVTGQSACADPAMFSKAIGEKLAYADAENKVWALMGYALKEKIAMVAAGIPPSKSNMETFVGTKVVHAVPMNRLAYNEFRGWDLPDDENGDDEGYLVEYADGGRANVEGYAGYISWSPKDVFERAYGKL